MSGGRVPFISAYGTGLVMAAVITGENNDGIIGYAQILTQFHQIAHRFIHSCNHACMAAGCHQLMPGIVAVAGLGIFLPGIAVLWVYERVPTVGARRVNHLSGLTQPLYASVQASTCGIFPGRYT